MSHNVSHQQALREEYQQLEKTIKLQKKITRTLIPAAEKSVSVAQINLKSYDLSPSNDPVTEQAARQKRNVAIAGNKEIIDITKTELKALEDVRVRLEKEKPPYDCPTCPAWLKSSYAALIDRTRQLMIKVMAIEERLDKGSAERMKRDKPEVRLFLEGSLEDVVKWVKGQSVD